jgi:hypothetical protein
MRGDERGARVRKPDTHNLSMTSNGRRINAICVWLVANGVAEQTSLDPLRQKRKLRIA